MFRRKPTTSSADLLLTGELTQRVQVAEDRLVYQHNPALHAALSERELLADREVAERIRDHHRSEKLAAIEAGEMTAAQIRKATEAIVKADARDLVMARRALADHRREDSAHAQLAKLYRGKRWCGWALAGVVIAAMLYSAVNVQHNLAPGGPSDPLYWISYVLEALISTVLVVYMVSGSAVARWGIDDDADLIRNLEYLLLAGSIGLNVFPYFRHGEWVNIGVHSVAPVMVGVALFSHDAVARRYGRAISRASERASEVDDTAERLAALHQLGETVQTVQPVPSYQTPAPETVNRAAETVQELTQTVHPAAAPAPATVQPAQTERARTVQSPSTEQSRTVQPVAETATAPEIVETVQGEVHAEQHTVQTDTETAPAGEAESVAQPVAAEDSSVWAEAHEVRERGLSGLGVDQLAEIFTLTDEQWTPAAIGSAIGVPGSRVLNVLEARRRVQQPPSALLETVHTPAVTVQSAPTVQASPEPEPSTEQIQTVQSPSTVQPTVQPETVQTVHTVQPETANRAAEPVTGQQPAAEDTELWALAAEVHAGMKRTKYTVADVAQVLIAHRRHGQSPDQIYRAHGPHRDSCKTWIARAAEIEADRAAGMAPVISLRDRG